jgi:integrase
MGRVCRVKYAWTNKLGQRVERYTKAWYIEYTDAHKKFHRRKAGITKEQALDALRKAEMDVLNEKNGFPSVRFGDIPLEALMKAYLEARRARASANYIKQAEWELRRLFMIQKIRLLRELTPDTVDAYLGKRLSEGVSATTANAALVCLKACLNWAVRMRRVPYNPIACIAPVEGEKRHVRRALREDEITRLLAAALEGPARRGMRRYQNRPKRDGSFKEPDVSAEVRKAWVEEGRNNVLVYRMMVETGLRRNECRSITWADVDLDQGTLTTRPHWDGNKNGKEEVLPLAPGLLTALKEWRLSHQSPPEIPILKITDRLLRCFNDDLHAAGLARKERVVVNGKKKTVIVKRDAAGRVLDLHALRHTFGTRLGRMPGVDPKSVQTLMRHSDPRMTFGVYVHSDKVRLAAAVALLPAIELTKNLLAKSTTANLA